MKTIRAIGLAFLFLCTYLYLSHKYETLSTPQEQVNAFCTPNHTPESVCECFNYYGRKCLSNKRLVWDFLTSEEE